VHPTECTGGILPRPEFRAEAHQDGRYGEEALGSQAQESALIDLVPASLRDYPCCGIKSSGHEGRRLKHCWLKTHFDKGLRAKILLVGDKPCGYIEYVPGEYAWRGVEASGYMVIHCVWMQAKRFQRKGMGSLMVQACVEEVTTAGMNGVAVVCREGPWLAGSAMYLANGFEMADTAPPDYHLLVRKLNRSAANPAFKGHWEQKLKRYGEGLTISRSSNQSDTFPQPYEDVALTHILNHPALCGGVHRPSGSYSECRSCVSVRQTNRDTRQDPTSSLSSK
jgi:hypothetical protein